MGNEVSTVGGAVATAATSVAAGVTFGQVDALNNAVVECSKFTANAASKTVVRHVGETVGTAVATGAVAVASGVTLGQVDALNQAVVKLGKHTAESAVASGKAVAQTTNEVANGLPVVGHIKGGIHYALGDKEGGAHAMKCASRTVGVVAGGIAGIPLGPGGMVAGGIVGGAVMDGVTTGAESAIKGEYTPSGQIKAWTDVVTGKDAQTVVGGVVGVFMSPVMDGVGGYAAGSLVKGRVGAAALEQDLAGFDIAEGARNANPALNEFMAQQQGIRAAGGSDVVVQGSLSGSEVSTWSGVSGSSRSSWSTVSDGPAQPPGPGNSGGSGGLGGAAIGGSCGCDKCSGSGECGACSGSTRSTESGESSCGSGRGSSSPTSWKTALSEGEDSIIDMAQLDDATLYRGMNKSRNPFEGGGHGKELGEGIRFTDSLENAIDYATTQYEPHYTRVQGEVYQFQFRGAGWQDYMKYWATENGGTVEGLVNVDEFKIIKTRHDNANQYWFSPHMAKVIEEKGLLVKLRNV